MKTRRWIWAMVMVMLIVGLACSVTQTETPTPVPTSTPVPTDTPAPTATPEPTATLEPTSTPIPEDTPAPTDAPVSEEEGATIEITNASGRDIWYVYISPSDADAWGDDWLEDDVILDGEVYLLTGIPEGVYDVQARDENDEPIQTFWEAEIEGDMTWTVVAVAALEIANESEDAIAELYISPASSDTWGEDLLGGSEIAVEAAFVVEDLDYDIYDAKVVGADGDLIEAVYNFPLNQDRTWTVYGKTDLPANAELRFEEDFADNRNNWGSTTEMDDVNYIPPQDGEYCIRIKSDNYTAWEWYEPFRTDEFIAEVACGLDPVADASCGLGFGPDGDNLYWFEVSPSDQTFALFLLQDGQWQEMLVDWTVSRNILPNAWNYLSLQRVDDVVSLFVNGVLVGQVDSDLFPTGRVGLGGSTYGEGDVMVCLDNLRVWRLE